VIESYATLCTIVEQGGKRVLKIFDRPDFDRALERFAVGEELDLEIRTLGRKRTLQQNRFFYGPVLKAFGSLGYHKQEAHDMLCLMFIPKELTLPDGSIVRVPGHTSALQVEEFNALIEQCIQLAAENELYIEDANEWKLKHERQLLEQQ